MLNDPKKKLFGMLLRAKRLKEEQEKTAQEQGAPDGGNVGSNKDPEKGSNEALEENSQEIDKEVPNKEMTITTPEDQTKNTQN